MPPTIRRPRPLLLPTYPWPLALSLENGDDALAYVVTQHYAPLTCRHWPLPDARDRELERIVRINDPSNADISWVTVVRTGIDDDHCGTGGPADDNDMERKCGRPLGLWLASRSSVDKNFNSDGEDAKDEDVLLVADAYRGFLMVTGITDQPVMHTLASRAESDPPDYTFKLLNAAVQVPSTGDIYITETSQIFERRRIFYAAMDG
eukprot:scaffold34823_cov160-Skeletonema_menzelii.AAC.1